MKRKLRRWKMWAVVFTKAHWRPIVHDRFMDAQADADRLEQDVIQVEVCELPRRKRKEKP